MGYEFALLFLVVVLLAVVVGVYIRKASKHSSKITLLDFILVWPAIFKLDRNSGKRTSTRFVVIGVLIYCLIVIASLKWG